MTSPIIQIKKLEELERRFEREDDEESSRQAREIVRLGGFYGPPELHRAVRRKIQEMQEEAERWPSME